MSNNLGTPVLNELLNLADSNWVLGHWYLVCILNSRGLQDASAMSAMAQDSLGHTRATLNFLEKEYGYDEMSLEFNRTAEQVHSIEVLDRAPQNWADFVVSLTLAEHAIWEMMSTFEKSSIPSIGGMLEAFGQENQFHRMNMDGWIQIFSEEEEQDADVAAIERLAKALAWFGTKEAADADPLLASGVRTHSTWEARNRFLAAVTKSLSLDDSTVSAAEDLADPSACDNDRRRPAGANLPAELWEKMVPTTEEAKLARRPLAVSITDELDLHDRPNSKNWDFEPIPI